MNYQAACLKSLKSGDVVTPASSDPRDKSAKSPRKVTGIYHSKKNGRVGLASMGPKGRQTLITVDRLCTDYTWPGKPEKEPLDAPAAGFTVSSAPKGRSMDPGLMLFARMKAVEWKVTQALKRLDKLEADLGCQPQGQTVIWTDAVVQDQG